MTMDSQTLTQLALYALAAFGLWYQHRMWTERCALTQRMAFAEGQLHILKNHVTLNFRGKKETGTIFWLFKRTIDKSLFIEVLEGKPIRVFGDTEDLSVFPELTAEQIAIIKKLLAAGVTAAVTAAIGAPGASSVIH